jgi:hypothetical protein
VFVVCPSVDDTLPYRGDHTIQLVGTRHKSRNARLKLVRPHYSSSCVRGNMGIISHVPHSIDGALAPSHGVIAKPRGLRTWYW